MKKFFCSLLICMMIFNILSPTITSVKADSSNGSGYCGASISWSCSNGVLTISGNGYMDNFGERYGTEKIPWEGLEIKKVIIGNGVKSIGNFAFFKNFTKIESIEIPESVEKIGMYAFSECTGLKEIHIPKSVKYIGESAFEKCTFSKIKLPESLEFVPGHAFNKCENLTEVTIPNSVTEIRNNAFNGCKNLKSVIFGENLRRIGENAFSDCSSLENIYINNNLVAIIENAFENCTSIKNVTYASESSKSKEVFEAHIQNGQTVTFETSGKCGENAYWNLAGDTLIVSGTGKVSVNDGESVAYTRLDRAIIKNSPIKTLIIGEGITEIDEVFISGNQTLENVILPSTLGFMDTYTFSSCKNLKYVYLPDGTYTISSCTFEGCKSLKNLYIPDNVTMDGLVLGTDSSGNKPVKSNITIYTPEFSKAYEWAKKFSYNVVASTRENYENTVTIPNIEKPKQIFTQEKADKSTYSAPSFKDITQETDYTNYIIGLGYIKLFKGDELGNFNPESTITRAEFATTVCRMLGYEKESNKHKGKSVFYDVPSSHWASGYVYVASELGIINGYGNGLFGPEDPVTYEQAIKMLVCAIDYDIPSICKSAGVACPSESIPYPEGYLAISDKYGLTDSAYSTGNNSSRKSVAKLIYIALSLPLPTSANDTSFAGDNLLYRIFDISSTDEFSKIIKNILNSLFSNNDSNIEPKMEFTEETIIFSGEEAENINNSIQSIHTTDEGYVVVIEDDTEFDGLKKDDVIFLNGSANTPFGEPYIGKVGHITDKGDYLSVNLVEPQLDEVFDEFAFDIEDVMEVDEIEAVELAEGLTVSGNGFLAKNSGDGTVLYDDTNSNDLSNAVLYAGEGPGANAWEHPGNSKLSISGSIDLLRIFDIGMGTGKQPTPMVYWLATGNAKKFHTSTCQYVRDKLYECDSCYITETDLYADYTACSVCRPPEPTAGGSAPKTPASLKLDISLSLNNLKANPTVEFNAAEGGLKTLALDMNGDVEFKTTLTSSISGKIQKKATSKNLVGENIKLSGLNKKTFPFFYVAWSPTGTSLVPMTGFANFDRFEDLTNWNPITFALVAYADVDGQISINGSIDFSAKKNINYKINAIKDYKPCFTSESSSSDLTWKMPITVGASGDLNIEESISFMLYIFNINIAELAIIKLEENATGSIKLTCQYGSEKNYPPKLDGDGYINCLLKLGELSIKAKLDISIYFLGANVGLSYNWTLYTKKIFEFGIPQSTEYDSQTMGVNLCTAYDKEYYYYKDKNGYLVRGNRNNPSNVSLMRTESFHSICAIDESYLYILTNNGNRYNLIRVSKGNLRDDGKIAFSERQLLDNVKKVFFQDNENIYYVDDFSRNTISMFNRKELTSKELVKFNEPVLDVSNYINESSGKYYVLTDKPSLLSFFTNEYNYAYIVNKNGVIERELERPNSFDEYARTEFNDYICVIDIGTQGIWNDTFAKSVTWVSKDGSKKVDTYTTGGWHYSDEGIFTIYDNSSGLDGKPYMLRIQQGKNGKATDVLPINSSQVFRAIKKVELTDYDVSNNKKKSNIWYIIDEESDGKWILYEIASNMINTKKIKEIPTNMSLSTCSICLLDNTLYIYSAKEGGNVTLVDTYTY